MKKGPDNNGSTENDRSKDSTKVKYIIPPGLNYTVNEFIAHCEAGGNQPIMVIGDTGVGKSMFLEIFEKLYRERKKPSDTESKIIWANCAHFGDNHSDLNMTKSELFGHVKYAFTGANKDKKGLVELANKGLLILEEIGELPRQVQAMLLTFIETGKYRKVGSTDLESSEVQLIGATNNEGKLRKDFRYRFFPFYVPSLHERRKDVLYYIGAEFPDLIKTLNSSEILALLAYHWPGNVRDVNRSARLMLRKKIMEDKIELYDTDRVGYIEFYNRLSESRSKSVDGLHIYDILDWVASWGGDDFLESRLKKYGLDVSLPLAFLLGPFRAFDAPAVVNLIYSQDDKSKIYPGSTLLRGETKAFIERSNIRIVPRIKAFDRAYDGFCDFCGLFGQNTHKNVNILDNLKEGENYFYQSGFPGHFSTPVKGGHFVMQNGFNPFYKDRSSYIVDTSDLKKKLPKEIYDFWSRLEEQVNSDILKDNRDELENQENHNKLKYSCNGQNCIDVSEMTEAQLLKKYYEIRLSITGGNVNKAAEQADVKNTTLRDRLDKLKVPFRKEDKDVQKLYTE